MKGVNKGEGSRKTPIWAGKIEKRELPLSLWGAIERIEGGDCRELEIGMLRLRCLLYIKLQRLSRPLNLEVWSSGEKPKLEIQI